MGSTTIKRKRAKQSRISELLSGVEDENMYSHLPGLKHNFTDRVILMFWVIMGMAWFNIILLPKLIRYLWLLYRNRNHPTWNIRYSDRRERNYLDIYQPKNVDDGRSHPVVIFCHGGGWDSGDKWHYVALADALNHKGILCVLIQYTLYPQGTIDVMIEDVHAALTWTKNNISKHGGDVKRMYFMGHSAGAHLGALTIMKQAVFPELFKDKVHLEGFIGLSGPYDLREYYIYEHKRGVEHLSPMKPTMRGLENLQPNSPTFWAKHIRHNSPKPARRNQAEGKKVEPICPHLKCKFWLMHGNRDLTVPHECSVQFAKELETLGLPVQYIEYDKRAHSDILFDFMDKQWDSPPVQDTLNIVTKGYTPRFQQP
eukprot:TRINITY_DN6434_c0_g1_i1.p1 TRINITY_DN6434_c0_g1~~TRINITY_DN6434_c0_g1_i1.p1  ORF type:complete len:404 (-),score=49.81 TRINITY_DN6434_c0_g1_i1:15-1124(-)